MIVELFEFFFFFYSRFYILIIEEQQTIKEKPEIIVVLKEKKEYNNNKNAIQWTNKRIKAGIVLFRIHVAYCVVSHNYLVEIIDQRQQLSILFLNRDSIIFCCCCSSYIKSNFKARVIQFLSLCNFFFVRCIHKYIDF